MPGPNSAPNGDTRIVRGHINEEFVCEKHYQELEKCDNQCRITPLRIYLTNRSRLRTGKTK